MQGTAFDSSRLDYLSFYGYSKQIPRIRYVVVNACKVLCVDRSHISKHVWFKMFSVDIRPIIYIITVNPFFTAFKVGFLLLRLERCPLNIFSLGKCVQSTTVISSRLDAVILAYMFGSKGFRQIFDPLFNVIPYKSYKMCILAFFTPYKVGFFAVLS